MRIIAGQFRGKKLLAPEGKTTRPTSDRAKEMLFNILDSALRKKGTHWSEIYFCDVFAGSGSIGLEALSRGAYQCCFFEKEKNAVSVLRKNTADIQGAVVKNESALTPSRSNKSADIIFMDPPYFQDLWQPALNAFLKQGYISRDTWVIVETDNSEKTVIPSGWIMEQKRQAGRNCFLFLKKSE